ncbi:hypothetical protein IUJ34_24120 [Klebsiella pneumoniae subsp. pneumoniae]|uniref:Uncharacterized protein n=1 Tax=Klebsiella pneumoniae subsp. pneumoniae TaxID=72407 RepID=A0A7S9E0W2_KLEPN|nr:hypothetical protein IUJ34_24120 [Klebsiella pneumoniae subsp. pneumoniae]
MLIASGAVRGVYRTLPEGEQPGAGTLLLRHPRFVGVLLLPVATCCCYVVLLIIVPLHFMGGEG